MEILKQNLDKSYREKLFSLTYVLSFVESILLGLLIGKCFDMYPYAWKVLLVISALLSLSSIFFQKRIPLTEQAPDTNLPAPSSNHIMQPWKDCLYLMRTYPDFAKFQWGFMIGGFGLMLINPALVIYYADTLLLSHERLTFARYIWMGFGVLMSTSLWRKALEKYSVIPLTRFILIGFSLFPFFLILAKTYFFFFYIAFLFYGVAQAGSHLLWHLSGTLFASESESSSKYTGTNVLMVGIRGLIGPALGGVLVALLGPIPVLILGITICCLGALFLKLQLKPHVLSKTKLS